MAPAALAAAPEALAAAPAASEVAAAAVLAAIEAVLAASAAVLAASAPLSLSPQAATDMAATAAPATSILRRIEEVMVIVSFG